MTVGIISIVLAVVGAVLIAIGVAISLSDRKRKIAEQGELKTEGTGGETLEGLAKLADALRGHPLGMQLIFLGTALLLAAAATAGAGAISSSI